MLPEIRWCRRGAGATDGDGQWWFVKWKGSSLNRLTMRDNTITPHDSEVWTWHVVLSAHQQREVNYVSVLSAQLVSGDEFL